MTRIVVSIVDVYPLRQIDGKAEMLLLQRGPDTRRTGSWEAVHGHIESGETPVAAARRELLEETGLTALRWYNLSRVELFYQHRVDEVALVPMFAAIVASGADIVLSPEHDRAEWLPIEEAAARYAWPRERRALTDIQWLLGSGSAGELEDVLRIP